MQTHLLSPFSGFIFILKELSKWESRSKPGMSFSFWSPLGLAAEVCDLVENYVGFHHVSVFLQGVWHWMCSFEAVALEYSLDGSQLWASLVSPLPATHPLLQLLCLSLQPHHQALLLNADVTWTEFEAPTYTSVTPPRSPAFSGGRG